MIKSNIKTTLNCPIEKAWNIITDNNNYSWRSDLSKIEVLDENTFIEYATNGFPTTFKITKKDYLKRYEFNIENQNLKGHWLGIFHLLENGMVEINFTEEIDVNNFLMKLLVKPYLKQQQNRYVNDLKKELMK